RRQTGPGRIAAHSSDSRLTFARLCTVGAIGYVPARRHEPVLGVVRRLFAFPEALMFPTPSPALKPNTYAFESSPLVKPTGFREYDARWLLDREINLMGVQALGMGLADFLSPNGGETENVTRPHYR